MMKTIDELYQTMNPGSRLAFERQGVVIPGGCTHAARQLAPFPLFIEQNLGAKKRDVDGHEYIDFWLAHGAMLLGHAHPAVLQAISDQAQRGLHAGGETELACEWARQIQEMVPSAELVRFLATGGEATQMAMRVARAYTGKDRIIKFESSFHGWHDTAAIGAPNSQQWPPGVPRAIAETVLVLPFNDTEAVERALSLNDDIAAVIMEPGGPFSDTILSDPKFLHAVRALTSQHGVLLIFDEVVTGFRYAPGGAQEYFGVTPDLTALGKVIGGGMPAGALVGRAEVMELFEWRSSSPDQQRSPVISHSGTWNAAPIVAAAGLATLRLIRETPAIGRAQSLTERLVDGFNSVFRDLNVRAFSYGRSSLFKLCLGERPPMVSGDFSSPQADAKQLRAGWGQLGPVLRKAMILEGVDLMQAKGYLSSAHTEEDVDATCQALARALSRMRKEGWL